MISFFHGPSSVPCECYSALQQLLIIVCHPTGHVCIYYSSFEIPHLIFKFKDTALFLFCTLFHTKIVTSKIKNSTKCIQKSVLELTLLYLLCCTKYPSKYSSRKENEREVAFISYLVFLFLKGWLLSVETQQNTTCTEYLVPPLSHIHCKQFSIYVFPKKIQQSLTSNIN